MFKNPSPDKIAQLLHSARVVAVVGLSADPSRPSHGVARALQGFGYRIIPVTPTVPSVLGQRSVPDLEHLPDVLGPGERVDIVDVFRRPEHVAAIVEDCVRLYSPGSWSGPARETARTPTRPALWLQDGVVDTAAAEKAVQAGLFTVMDRCLYRDRAALG